MVSKLRLVFTITIVFFSFYGFTQDNYWQQEAATNKIDSDFSKRYGVEKGIVFSFNEAKFKRNLQRTSFSKNNSKTVFFPDKNGQLIAFKVVERSVLSAALAQKYPEIKSYAGYALSNSNDKIRFSVSHNGIQAMIVPADGTGNSYLQKNANGKYVLYNRNDNTIQDTKLVCSTLESMANIGFTSFNQPINSQQLRKFRLAVSASGEYTQFHGGSVADALAAINATITRVNEVFETDLAVTFQLIADTDDVIYTDPATDPYTGNLSANVQSTMTATIGAANYDIGILLHRIPTGGDGNSGFIGSVCKDNQKGSAYAATPNPSGDNFDLDFVAHEIGHQFGANHSFSHIDESSLIANVQVEPGSGTTIMGYAGISEENNVAAHGDDYFHYASIVQMANFLTTISCAEVISLTNTPPVVTPVSDFVIPKSTAFVLTTNATDADASDVLTYTWEQVDDGIVTTESFGPTSFFGANFRSQKPSVSPKRYFPKLSRVIDGNLTQTNPTINSAWETVSNVKRDLNFAITVRDNAIGGGQVASDLVKVSVSNQAGPFVVTSQSSSVSINAGTTESITWDVANTFNAPISATTVDIFLSTDGGLTFPIILADDVANDGEHTIIIPGNPTTQARIMIKANNNIFFAVNSADFTIAASEIVLNFDELNFEVCQSDTLVVPFVYETDLGFTEPATFSVNSPPAGLNIAFSPLTATVDETPVNITFTNTESLSVGIYPINVLATSMSITKEITINLEVYGTSFSNVTLVAPLNGAIDISKSTLLEWDEQFLATSYEIEIATDMAFNTIIETAEVISNSYLPENLNSQTTYYWRVKPENSCGEGTYGTPFSFTTIVFNCITKIATDLPIVISPSGTPTITSKITFYEDKKLEDIKVALELDHSFLRDIQVSLTSPLGTKVDLFTNACNNLQNVDAVFDDDAPNFICSGMPAIDGTVSPSGSLDSFKGESILGDWTLTIADTTPSDGGVLKSFSLEVCAEGIFRPDDDNDGVFDDGPDLCLNTPIGTPVDASGCPIYLFASDNFSIGLQSEACRSSNDGSITIVANETLDYTVQIIGNGITNNDDFNTTYSLPDLGAGTYSVCINAIDGAIVYEEQCFEVVITEPEALSVNSKVFLDARLVELDLTGGAMYSIELNGVLTQTQASKISLNLKEGNNTLKVATDLPCQGTYEEQLYVFSEVLAYPNPFDDNVNIAFAENVDVVEITVFSAEGRLVKRLRQQVNGVDLNIDLSILSKGIYYFTIDAENINKKFKLLKR